MTNRQMLRELQEFTDRFAAVVEAIDHGETTFLRERINSLVDQFDAWVVTRGEEWGLL